MRHKLRLCHSARSILIAASLAASMGCTGTTALTPPREAQTTGAPKIMYVGSSTIAGFIREATPVYGRAEFILDTIPESLGGERAMQEGYADLAGVAREPSAETLDYGANKLLLGVDTIAVVVNVTNPAGGLTLEDLRAIFTRKIVSWKDVGGPDIPIVPMVVGEESATNTVFREIVLKGEPYVGCKVIRPDSEITSQVEAEPGAIGAISHSFVCSGGPVRVLRVSGEPPQVDNTRYPIVRPLYLLWRQGKPEVEDFVRWTQTKEAREVLSKCFRPPPGK